MRKRRSHLESTLLSLALAFVLAVSPSLAAEEQSAPVEAPSATPGPYERVLPRHLEVLRGTADLHRGEPMRRATDEPATSAPSSAPASEGAPALVWAKRYQPNGTSDIARDMALGPDKSVYVTGETGLFGDGNHDAVTMKIRPNGRLRWIRRFNSRPGSFERGEGVAHDSRGNAYVVGSVGETGGLFRLLVLKYAPAGRLAWTLDLTSVSLGGEGNALGAKVAVDDFDNIYVLGQSVSATSSRHDLITLKLDPMGNILWHERWEGNSGTEWPVMIRVDPGGNVVVLAWGSGNRGGLEWATLKYSPEGLLLWERRLLAPQGFGGRPGELTVGDDESVHVAGYRTRPSSVASLGWDLVAAKYSPFGTRDWRRIHRGPEQVAWGNSVDVDAEGNVFVGGRVENGDDSTGPDFLVIKYDARGRVQWKRIWVGRPVWSIEEIFRVRATGDGGVIVAGGGWPPGKPDYDYIFQRYSSDGTLQWTKAVDSPGMNDFVRFMELDGEGGIYASGYTWTGDEHDIFTIKLQEQ